MEEKEELENVSKVMKDSTLSNPDLTFCEKTTYLDFLLSNAKDEEEAQQIKETINDYLDLYDDEEEEDESNK
ncbi:MAG TPA: hypothetical protein IAC02_03615 [Candidatus Coprovivens excrementavium]|nr:hypothetical protein [Candidatus Coprovivens excrementavium]